MSSYEILGEQIVREVSGFDVSALISAAAEGGQQINKYVEEDKASKKSASETAAQLAKAISADAALAGAEATLDLAKQGGDIQRTAAAQTLRDSAAQSAMSAGAGLPSDAVGKRVNSAQSNAQKAAEDAVSAPKDAAKQAKMRAWQKVASQAGLSGGGGGGGAMIPYHGGHEASFFTKVYAGVPVWGWGAGALLVGVGGYLLLRKRR